jgi:hypothetical protein
MNIHCLAWGLCDQLNGAKLFLKIDPLIGYNQICERDHDIEKTVFSSRYEQQED